MKYSIKRIPIRVIEGKAKPTRKKVAEIINAKMNVALVRLLETTQVYIPIFIASRTSKN